MAPKQRTGIGGKIILGLTALFFYLPILYIIVFSFNDSRSLTKFSGFSLQWYERMFSDRTMMQAVVYTIVHTGDHYLHPCRNAGGNRAFPLPPRPAERGGTSE